MLDLITASDSLETGHPFAAILNDSDTVREIAVRDAVASAGQGARIIRVANTPDQQLTTERLVFQLSAARTDGRAAANATIRQLCAPGVNEDRTVLVIDHAETLDGSALRALQTAGLESNDSEHPLQVLFAGKPLFLSRLRDPELALIRYTVTTDSPDLEGYPAAPASVPNDLPSGWLTPKPMPERHLGPCRLLPAEDAPPERNRHAMQAALVLTTAMLSAIASWRDVPPQDVPPPPAYTLSATETPAMDPPTANAFTIGAPAAAAVVGEAQTSTPLAEDVASVAPDPARTPSAETPGSSDTSTPAADPKAQAALTVPAEDEQSRLRRDFDAFLLNSGQVASRLTETQRQLLFDEFQTWRQRVAQRKSVASTLPVPGR